MQNIAVCLASFAHFPIFQQWKSNRPPVMTRASVKSESSEKSTEVDIVREEPGTVIEEELPKSGMRVFNMSY